MCPTQFSQSKSMSKVKVLGGSLNIFVISSIDKEKNMYTADEGMRNQTCITHRKPCRKCCPHFKKKKHLATVDLSTHTVDIFLSVSFKLGCNTTPD